MYSKNSRNRNHFFQNTLFGFCEKAINLESVCKVSCHLTEVHFSLKRKANSDACNCE